MSENQAVKMDTFTAVGLAEGFVEAESEEQILEAWQYLVDTGLCWQLQGSFGRAAVGLIQAGEIMVSAGMAANLEARGYRIPEESIKPN